MAGQGVHRREVLQILGTAAAAARFSGFSKWAYACGHFTSRTLTIRPAVYRPQFFTPSEYGIIERLSEIIIPSGVTPGAKEAGVAEFIDFMVASNPEVQYNFRTGLTWLDAHAVQVRGKKFVELTIEDQNSLLEPLGFKDKARPADEAGRRFFATVREYTVFGFYTSETGFKELDNPALKFYGESPECPHKDDREHTHLPPAGF